MKRREFSKGLLSTLVFVSSGRGYSSGQLSREEQVLFGVVRPNDIQGKGFNLRAKAAGAFEVMSNSARRDGINIYSLSSYRGFEHQSKIWNRKFSRFSSSLKSTERVVQEIVKYSAIPGTSRHHWGTDLDIIDLNPNLSGDMLTAQNYLKGGAYHDLYQWLLKHAHTYGFYEAYTNDPNRTGFKYEPWHWSFAELSIPMLENFVSLPLHNKLPLQNVKGHTCLNKEFLDHYKKHWCLGINAHLRPSSKNP